MGWPILSSGKKLTGEKLNATPAAYVINTIFIRTDMFSCDAAVDY